MDKSHTDMINQMEAIGHKILEEKTNSSKDELLEGFHWPIASVQHLHLHFIAPKQQMNCFKKIEFNSWGFGNVQQAIEALENRDSK